MMFDIVVEVLVSFCFLVFLYAGSEQQPVVMMMLLMMLMTLVLMLGSSSATDTVNISAARQLMIDDWWNPMYARQSLSPDQRYYFEQVTSSNTVCRGRIRPAFVFRLLQKTYFITHQLTAQ